MRIMLTGANGQIGYELSRCLLPIGDVFPLDHFQCDLSKLDLIPSIVDRIRPDIIINAAAYTSVDKAEKETELAEIINGIAVEVLAKEALSHNALLVHFSTDYVFDGNRPSPYSERDIPNPKNAYGRSKLIGDNAIQKINPNYLILRTSWVYSTHGNNFLKTILKLSSERDELNVVNDQRGSPTWARNIADATGYIIQRSVNELTSGNFSSDLYNLVSAGDTTWYGFAKAIIEEASDRNILSSNKQTVVHPISTEQFKLPAKRPCNSILSTNKIVDKFQIRLPDWRTALAYCPFPKIHSE